MENSHQTGDMELKDFENKVEVADSKRYNRIAVSHITSKVLMLIQEP